MIETNFNFTSSVALHIFQVSPAGPHVAGGYHTQRAEENVSSITESSIGQCQSRQRTDGWVNRGRHLQSCPSPASTEEGEEESVVTQVRVPAAGSGDAEG